MIRAAILLGALAVLAAGCDTGPRPHVVIHQDSPDGRHRAEVRLTPCGEAWCHSLWTGEAGRTLGHVATLPADSERCDEIAWSRDGGRVAFLVNGYQLRLYEPRTRTPAGLVDLVPADGPPTTRIARGITFSDNGRALTFDDCPRSRSGCRPGLVALR